MWAHYSRDFAGLVLEFDEDLILENYPDLRIENISYSETPNIIDSKIVMHAFMRGKFRHTYFLYQKAFNAAYFTKSIYWNYEYERRLLIDKKHILDIGGHMIVKLPINCLTGIISGHRTDSASEHKLISICDTYNLNHYRIRIGRSYMRSFFLDSSNDSYIFNGQRIDLATSTCETCGEPLEDTSQEACHWCAISEADRYEAACRNPLRLLANVGMLEEYVNSMQELGKKSK